MCLLLSCFKKSISSYLRGAGQVMFQCNAATGILFLCGIIWGAYHQGTPQVAYGALLGCMASTISGFICGFPFSEGKKGLWGFDGILVGCAIPTFISMSWQMWAILIFCAMLTTPVRRALDNILSTWKIGSLTFSFVFLTWIFLLATSSFQDITAPAILPESVTEILDDKEFANSLISQKDILIYWLKGISQIFLINSWVTGIFFLAGLWISSRRAALWAAIASAVALLLAITFKGNTHDITNGLYGFSPVLTGIAIGATFYKASLRNSIIAIAAIATTFFIQASMNTLLAPWGLPTLTAPFCIATWLFLLPRNIKKL